jgi:hypothetical protein
MSITDRVARSACYAIDMWFVVKILFGVALFWLWFFFGSRDNCPRCGKGLVDYYDYGGALLHSTRRRSCACGWHE